MSERALLGVLTEQLKALRLPDEDTVIVSLAAERDPECEPESNSAIRATVCKRGVTVSAAAIHLQDALLLARGEADRQIKANAEANAKKKERSA